MTTEMESQLAELKQGDHVCLIYENATEQLAVAVPFIKDGLARGERCLYVADDLTDQEVAQALSAAGVDVVGERQRGALRFIAKTDSYLRDGTFAPQAMLDLLNQTEAEALADGHSGLRFTAEMTWALGPEPGCERLIEYEALINELNRNQRSVLLCQYNRARFDSPCIHDVLRTHRLAILGDQVCDNPHYERPDMVLSEHGSADSATLGKRVDWWIAQLRRARAAERERQRALELLRHCDDALRESQQLLHSVLTTLPVGVMVTDRAADVILANPAAKCIWGDVIVSGRERWTESRGFWHESGQRIAPEDWASARALLEGQTSLNELIDIETFDGKQKTIQNSAAPIRNAEGQIVGVVIVNEDATERVRAQKALRESAARLQHLSRRLLAVQEDERRHLARELHDEVGQLLTGLRLLLEFDGAAGEENGQARLEQARAIVDGLLDKVRGLSFDLRPAVLDQLGLMPALHELFESYTRQTGVQVNFKHKDVDKRFAPQVETTTYRIVQEALTNVARHAGVANVTVRVWATRDLLSVQIEDRGCGFDPEAALAAPRSSGLAGMRERASLLSGELTIDSRPGAGTQITAEIPLGAAEK